MASTYRKVKRVILDGPRVLIEWETGNPDLTVHPNRDDAIADAARTAARLGTYVHDTARQEALAFLP
jgi:hypothetical protein